MPPTRRKSTTPAIRVLAHVSFAFGAGALLGSLLPQFWLALLFGGLCALLAVLFGLLPARHRLRWVLISAGAATGLLWCGVYTVFHVLPLTELDGQVQPFTALVLEAPTYSSYSSRVPARVQGVGTVTLYLESGEELEPGDILSGTASYQAASQSSQSSGVFLYASSKDAAVTGHINSPRTWPGRASALLKEGIAALYDGENAGLFQALLTGDKSGLPTALSTALSRCGLSHMVAISGMHMGILASVLLLFLRNRKLRLLCLPVLLFFTLMVGSVSAWRALLMEGLMLLAPLVRREADGITSLSFALLLILLANPYSIRSVSLQLSFAAMLGIFLVTQPLYQVIEEKFNGFKAMPAPGAWLCRGFFGTVCTSIGASALTIPLVAWHFRQISLVSLLANLLVLWMLSAALVLGLLSVLLVLIFPEAAPVLRLLPELIARVILTLVHGLGGLTFAALPLSSIYLIVWFFFLLAAVVLAAATPRLRRKPLIPICAVILILCSALLLNRLTVDHTAATIKVLDVGEGQCILLISQGCTAAIDCGGSGYDSAGDLLADELQSLGIDRLDLLLLTHYDGDHSNGLEELFARISVGTTLIPDVWCSEDTGRDTLLSLAEEQGTGVGFLSALTEYAFGQGTLTVYPPADPAGGNNGGLAVLGQFGEFSLLVTGDMDTDGERILQARYDLPDIDLLIAGHHGSKYSTSEDLLQAVTPETAVISVGDNSYGHPAPETLQRLSDAGVQIYRTDVNGMVTLRIYE